MKPKKQREKNKAKKRERESAQNYYVPQTESHNFCTLPVKDKGEQPIAQETAGTFRKLRQESSKTQLITVFRSTCFMVRFLHGYRSCKSRNSVQVIKPPTASSRDERVLSQILMITLSLSLLPSSLPDNIFSKMLDEFTKKNLPQEPMRRDIMKDDARPFAGWYYLRNLSRPNYYICGILIKLIFILFIELS